MFRLPVNNFLLRLRKFSESFVMSNRSSVSEIKFPAHPFRSRDVCLDDEKLTRPSGPPEITRNFLSQKEKLNRILFEAKSMPVQEIEPLPKAENFLENKENEEVKKTLTNFQNTDEFKEFVKPEIPKKFPAGFTQGTQVEICMIFDFEDCLDKLANSLVDKIVQDAQLTVAEETAIEQLKQRRLIMEEKIHSAQQSYAEMESNELYRAGLKSSAITRSQTEQSNKSNVIKKFLALKTIRQFLVDAEDQAIQTLEENGKLVDDDFLKIEKTMIPEIQKNSLLYLERHFEASAWIKSTFNRL